MKYIELFAGCGGLSLGLDSVSAELMFANELSPMAAETYAFNFFSEDLTQTGNSATQSRVKWLSSSFSKADFNKRLRENPHEFPNPPANSDIQSISDFDKSLLVGDIRQLNALVELILSGKHPKISKTDFEERFCDGAVDLVSGGPPCQSFSMAGMRELSNQRNTLPWEFAKFVSHIQPKAVLLENVQGILNAFIQNGSKFFAWFEVAKAFAAIGYVPICLLVNARYVGVAQNRPRYVMLALRAPLAAKLAESAKHAAEQATLKKSLEFFSLCRKQSTTPTDPKSLGYIDLTKSAYQKDFQGSFLSHLYGHQEVSVKEAIDDLKQKQTNLRRSTKKNYGKTLSSVLSKHLSHGPLRNHEMRANTHRVKMRFHLYQTLRDISTSSSADVKQFIRGITSELSISTIEELLSKAYMGHAEGEWIRFETGASLMDYIASLRTKKQTQKALDPDRPAPATLSIPDDACHYEELRTLSVREMARIQSFPDEFQFRSKVTTGGTSRRFEVPQYTQVGNAVPPLLGRALGMTIIEILSEAESHHQLDSSPSKQKKAEASIN